jgi:hypothetical protein
MDKITFEMSFEGLVTGGIICFIEKGNSYEKEMVFDLPDWIEKQFLELRKIAEDSQQQNENKFKAYRHIWIGDAVFPFAMLVTTFSNYWAIYQHPECRNELLPKYSKPNDISFNMALRASKVSNLNVEW